MNGIEGPWASEACSARISNLGMHKVVFIKMARAKFAFADLDLSCIRVLMISLKVLCVIAVL